MSNKVAEVAAEVFMTLKDLDQFVAKLNPGSRYESQREVRPHVITYINATGYVKFVGVEETKEEDGVYVVASGDNGSKSEGALLQDDGGNGAPGEGSDESVGC